jgi:hypothetical protein
MFPSLAKFAFILRGFFQVMKQALVRLFAVAALALAAPASPALAQIQPVDPDTGASWQPEDAPAREGTLPPEPETSTAAPQSDWTPIDPPAPEATTPSERSAEHVFGNGAAGLAGIIEDILKDQGEPIAYIAGEEASGAFIVGARWGSGVMRHRVEGDRVVYWTGPSIGFDVGADASKVFILVYNLRDSQQLFRRYAGGEGRAYFVGGFTATYLRRGDVVLIPVRLGVGVRLGVNAGYMRFSERNRWLPF